MPELAAPAWLLALALVPLVRWLHRFRAAGRELRVPALFLWRAAVLEHQAGPRRGPPDPAWRRRALLLALLALALAGPSLPLTRPATLEVWLDDDPALFAREADGTARLALAAESIARALAEDEAPIPELRALRRPGERRSPTGRDAQAIAAALTPWLDGPGEGPPMPPPSAAERRRWLVSTGADARLAPVLAQARFQRLIPVGAATENLAVTGLSVRPSLPPPHGPRALVSLINAGQAPARPSLELRLSGRTLARAELTLEPGETAAQGFALPPGTAGRLTAVLLPNGEDGLALDDWLGLDLPADAGTTSVTIQGDCPRPVGAFVAAHPGLAQRPAADLRISCGTAPPPGDLRSLWLPGTPTVMAPARPAKALVGAMPVSPLPAPPSQGGTGTGSASGTIFSATGEPADALPVWTADVENPPALPAGLLRPLARPAGVDGRVLLAAGEVPLLIEQAEPPRLVLLADLAGAAGRPELPALLDWALSRLAGGDPMLPELAAARDPAEASIAPGPLPPAVRWDVRGTRTEAAPWLLAAALLLSLYDLRRAAV